jgi:hypothetical protein
MPLPVTGHRQRVDRIQRTASGAQARHQQPPRRLDRHRYRRLRAVAGLGQHLQQLAKAGRVVTDAPLGHQSAVGVDHGHVVVFLRPVDPQDIAIGIPSGRHRHARASCGHAAP